jgi:hypothetical protein
LAWHARYQDHVGAEGNCAGAVGGDLAP